MHIDHQATIAGNVQITNQSSVSVTGNIRVDQNASIGTSLHVDKSISTTTLSVSGSVNATSLYASSIIATSLELVGDEALPLQSRKGYESSHGGIEVAKDIISHGRIAAKHGVATSNLTAFGFVNLEGGATYIESLSAGDIIVNKQSNISTNVENIWVRNGGNVTVETPGIIHAKGGILIENGTQSYMNGKVTASGRFHMKDSLKVDGGVTNSSLFTSRIYTEDISARGFVSASTLVSTGDVNVSGSMIVHSNIKVDETIEANSIVSQNSISCKTATIDGVVTAVGLTVQKAKVGELIVQDVNLLEMWQNEMTRLNDRIEELERRIALE